jgi:hypothetical protein
MAVVAKLEDYERLVEIECVHRLNSLALNYGQHDNLRDEHRVRGEVPKS